MGKWTMNGSGVMHEGLVISPASFYSRGVLRSGTEKQTLIHASCILAGLRLKNLA